ncbi:MAG: PAS domain S-box protein [Planctomycetes bacterium]|nr:PAS domain S-box protein [Planctomycetota bacterium]
MATPETEDRVLVLMPTQRDAARTCEFLAGAGLAGTPCADPREVRRELAAGAGVVLLTDEALGGGDWLSEALANQPTWSDLPMIVLSREGAGHASFRESANVTLVERPVRMRTLLSVVRAALRTRRHQYDVRDLLTERQRAAETLRDERERLRITLASIGDAVISTDAAGRITFLNGVAEALTEWTRDEAAGRPLPEVFRIVNESTRHVIEDPAMRSLREGAVIGLANNSILIARGGAERPIDDSAAPIRDKTGVPVGSVLVFRDVTERRRIEIELARLAAIVASSQDAIISKTLNGVIRTWNRGAERIFGYTAAEVVGKPVTVIIPPERLNEERMILERLLCGERIDHFETVRVAKDGRRLDVSLTVSPIRDSEGNIVGASKIARDITDRVRDAAALRASEARYRAIIEATPECVNLVAPNGTLLQMNRAGLAMIEGDESALGRCMYNVVAPEDRDRFRAFNERICQGEAGTLEFDIVGLQGSRRHMETSAVPLLAATGGFMQLAVSRDITERKRAEIALREADRKKDDFIALLAHELRNPLAPIRNGLQVIRLSDDRSVRERSLGVMDRQLTHMVRLIDDLLDVSRINRNKMELRRERIPLADAVGCGVETARPAIEAARHMLEIDLPPGPLQLDADLTRLAQVFANLLTNSAKYTEPGGTIRLAARRDEDAVVVTVRDTGIGIPAESLPHVFEMFSQVDRSVERSTGGLGIGLALVKGLVEMHGGTVTAASEGQGKGSTFTVRLPAPPELSESLPDTPADAEGAGSGPQRRILVVDDNRDGAESMAEMLRLFGNEVFLAHDGVDAVDRAEAVRPEVILMDVGMPRMNGLEATRRIRARPWGRVMTIIALTGWGQEGDRRQSEEAGCDGHLVKPVSLADLERAIGVLAGVR